MAVSQNTKPQPVLLAASILAGITALSGALSAAVLNNPYVVGFALVVAALNVGVAMYVKGQVVPFTDTAAYKNDDGVVVAGPASADIISNGTPVDVTLPLTPGGII